MKINRLNVQNYLSINKEFSETTSKLIEEIFQAQSVGNIGYQISEEDNLSDDRFRNTFNKSIKTKNYVLSEREKKIVADFNDLGPVEKKIISQIANSSYTTIVLTGALGVGKTALLDFTSQYIKGKSETCCKSVLGYPLTLKINFNEGFVSKKTKDILSEFQILLFNQLRHTVDQIFTNHPDMLDKLFFEILYKGKTDWHVHFDNFIYSLKITKEDWQLLSTEEKIEYFLGWIDDHDISILSYKIRLISYLINFIKANHTNNNLCFFVIFDNVDKFKDEVQFSILSDLINITEISKVKTIIALRLTGFGHVIDNGSFTFDHIEMAGMLPEKIIIKRINHYLENKTDKPYFQYREKIPFEFLSILDNRLMELRDLFSDKDKNRVLRIFEAISGVSVRRSLLVVPRLLLNSVYSYKSTIVDRDSYARALLVDENLSSVFDPEDEYVSNIFYSHTTKTFSMICIRILQILHEFRNNNSEANIGELLIYLKRFNDWTDIEIADAINYLIMVNKRLAYIDGKRNIKLKGGFSKYSNLKIRITWSGVKYLKVLIKELVYIQESFSTISWSDEIKINKFPIRFFKKIFHEYYGNPKDKFSLMISEIMPNTIDNSKIEDRISFIRRALGILLWNDIAQMIMYINHNGDKEDIQITSLISNDIISNISISILRITITHYDKFNIKEELKNWESLLELANYFSLELLKTNDQNILDALSQYKREVKNITSGSS